MAKVDQDLHLRPVCFFAGCESLTHMMVTLTKTKRTTVPLSPGSANWCKELSHRASKLLPRYRDVSDYFVILY